MSRGNTLLLYSYMFLWPNPTCVMLLWIWRRFLVKRWFICKSSQIYKDIPAVWKSSFGKTSIHTESAHFWFRLLWFVVFYGFTFTSYACDFLSSSFLFFFFEKVDTQVQIFVVQVLISYSEGSLIKPTSARFYPHSNTLCAPEMLGMLPNSRSLMLSFCSRGIKTCRMYNIGEGAIGGFWMFIALN